MKNEICEIVTERIIKQLEAGVAPWKKNWSMANDMPSNYVSKKTYRGVNIFLLLFSGYASNQFLTYKQAQELGGTVKKGEKGWPVIYFKFLDSKNEFDSKGNPKQIPMMRYYTVFNVLQCEGIPALDLEKREDVNPIEACEAVVAGYQGKPEILNNGLRPGYQVSTDKVEMPEAGYFENDEAYYSVLFHELTHSTGSQYRLNRKTVVEYTSLNFGTQEHGEEELIAELGASFLGAHCELETQQEQNAAYCQAWLKQIKGDSSLIIRAAGKAQRAFDHILGVERSE